MTPEKQQRRLDFLAAQYLAAIESSDFEKQQVLWHMAETEPDLDAVLNQVHDDLLEDDETDFVGEIARTVAATMPSAELLRPAGAEVTLAEVTAELTREGVAGWTAAEHELNAMVQSSGQDLPADLGHFDLLDWAERKFGSEAARLTKFWDAFGTTAARLRIRSESDYQVAARRTTPRTGGKE